MDQKSEGSAWDYWGPGLPDLDRFAEPILLSPRRLVGRGLKAKGKNSDSSVEPHSQLLRAQRAYETGIRPRAGVSKLSPVGRKTIGKLL